jgi:hypothetical protein
LFWEVSVAGVNPIFTMGLPPPIKPKTRIKMSGKAKLKTTAEGLRKMALKLALEIFYRF